MGRPLKEAKELSDKYDLRVSKDISKKIEEYRQSFPVVPTKSEILRHLIKRGLETVEAN